MHSFFFRCFLFLSSLFALNTAIAQPLAQTLNVSTVIEAQVEAIAQSSQSFVLALHQGASKLNAGLSEDSFLSKVTTLQLDLNSSLRAVSAALTKTISYVINDHQIVSDVVDYQYRRAFLHIHTRSRDLINLS